MTDHQQAAIEAAAQQHSPHLWDGRFRDSLLRLRGFTPEIADEAVEKRRAEILAEAEEYITAAEPHLRKKWATEVIDELDTARATGKVYTYGDVQELIRNGAVE